MGAVTRRFPILFNAIDEIAVDEVDKEAVIPYSCPIAVIVTITLLPDYQTLPLRTLQQCRTQVQGPQPLLAPQWHTKDEGTT
jgi:hypothetical protein